MVDATVAPRETVPLVCLGEKSGRSLELVEGEVAGTPAVDASQLYADISPKIATPLEVDGERVFVGEHCAMFGTPLCDAVLYMRRGETRYVVTWINWYASQQAVPADSAAILAEPRVRAAVARLRALEVDDDTREAFVTLSAARHTRTTAALAQLAGGLAVATAGHTTGNEDAKRAGRDLGSDALRALATVDPAERPFFEAHPKLLELLTAARVEHPAEQTINAGLCVGPWKGGVAR
jgi:hypothetical protein